MGEDHTGWTNERLILRQWLEDQNPQLAETYAIVVKMMFGPWIPGYTCFVCHGVREIGNRLPDVVLGAGESRRLEYRDQMDPIADSWRRSGIPDALVVGMGGAVDTLKTPATPIGIPYKLAETIGKLVDAHLAVREKNVDRAVRFFEYFMSPDQVGPDIIRAKANVWRDTVDWFVARTHLRVDDHADVPYDDLLSHFNAFESPLTSLFAGFYDTQDEIDAILDEANRYSS